MNTKLLLLCVLLAFAWTAVNCFSEPIILTADLGSTKCKDYLSCLSVGDDCKSAWNFETNANDYCLSNNGSLCCAENLSCYNGKCATDNLGSKCAADTDCFSVPTETVACFNQTCQYVYAPGDSCSVDSDCISGLTCDNGLCAGLATGAACTSDDNCDINNFCQLGFCALRQSTGDGCSANRQCASGLICMDNAVCGTGYTVESGGSCTLTSQCEDMNICSGGVCTSAPSSQPKCSQTSDCKNTGAQLNVCVCSLFSGESFCEPTLAQNACGLVEPDLFDCMNKNNCTKISTNPESCTFNECYSDLKKQLTCSCSFDDKEFSTCLYNSYCGGFPIWAIIIIVLVAVLIVLCIVMLVFYTMRRRQDYDSI
eukprot:TRINITY_DN2256_c0_g1_i1.p1 TRINITY_DN2256_c0_g1~~TRINITY_DN2256_c0_g1_i1.p1  ORF type:complete len:369 (-),score=93.83 TRINITY_DN2256_c0_g1_i1:112-1218(-)